MHPRVIEVGEHADGTLRDRSRFNLPPLAGDLLAVRMDAALNFLTATTLERFITEARSSNPAIRRVLLSASGINDIDASGIETLQAIQQTLRGEGIELYLTAVKKQVWDVIERAGVLQSLGSEHVFTTDRQAIAALAGHQATAG